jgi:hypothetical protein
METAHLTADAILDHPHFRTCRNAYIDAVLELYEFNPTLIELMRDGGRIIVYAVIMALWGGYLEEEMESLPTIGRLKKTVDLFEVASSRQIDLIIARFTQVGHIRLAPAPADLRMRLLLPTASLIDHDRAFIRAHYAALAALFGPEAYPLPLIGDLAFLKAMRGAWIATLKPMAKEIVTADPLILRIYTASAGMLMLMKLVRMQDADPDGQIQIDYSDLGRRLNVSRTHVRTFLKSVAAHGDIEFDTRGSLRLSPALIAALDRNIAGRMSLLDRAHTAALMNLSGN